MRAAWQCGAVHPLLNCHRDPALLPHGDPQGRHVQGSSGGLGKPRCLPRKAAAGITQQGQRTAQADC